MSNGIKTNSAEEIIDLTDLVSIGNGAGEADDTPKNEEDVLDSLVNDLKTIKAALPEVKPPELLTMRKKFWICQI